MRTRRRVRERGHVEGKGERVKDYITAVWTRVESVGKGEGGGGRVTCRMGRGGRRKGEGRRWEGNIGRR